MSTGMHIARYRDRSWIVLQRVDQGTKELTAWVTVL